VSGRGIAPEEAFSGQLKYTRSRAAPRLRTSKRPRVSIWPRTSIPNPDTNRTLARCCPSRGTSFRLLDCIPCLDERPREGASYNRNTLTRKRLTTPPVPKKPLTSTLESCSDRYSLVDTHRPEMGVGRRPPSEEASAEGVKPVQPAHPINRANPPRARRRHCRPCARCPFDQARQSRFVLTGSTSQL
jgi:hypothetical protein